MSDIGDKNMKWDNDRFSYEKHLVMDVIIKFSETFEGKDHSKISIKELTDFNCFIVYCLKLLLNSFLSLIISYTEKSLSSDICVSTTAYNLFVIFLVR